MIGQSYSWPYAMQTVSLADECGEQGTCPLGHFCVTGSTLIVSMKLGPPLLAQIRPSALSAVMLMPLIAAYNLPRLQFFSVSCNISTSN